jgi:hypothetical protein
VIWAPHKDMYVRFCKNLKIIHLFIYLFIYSWLNGVIANYKISNSYNNN